MLITYLVMLIFCKQCVLPVHRKCGKPRRWSLEDIINFDKVLKRNLGFCKV